MGWHVDVLTTDATFKRILYDNGIGVVDLDVIRREIDPLCDLWGLYRLYQFLRHSGYEVVHTHTSKGGFVGRLAARLARIPVIIHTVHGFAFHEQSSPVALRCYSLLERLAASWCDRIVTVSQFHRDWALRLGIGDEQRVVAIPNGIDEGRVSATREASEVRRDLGLKPEDFVILAVGRLAPQKGLEYLIAAVPILQSRSIAQFKVLLLGDGPLHGKLQTKAKARGVDDKVIFLGFRKDVGDLLAASDLVVLPSLWEGLSIALLEAMAASKPIVTTSIGSNLEVVQDGVSAVLVPPKDPGALAEAIIRLYSNPQLRERLGSEARRVFEERYTEERMLQAYMDLYSMLFREKAKTI